MLIDLQADWVVTGVISGVGLVVGLYSKAIKAENAVLKSTLDSMSKQYEVDMSRIQSTHEDIWQEIKCQRESLAQSREAIIMLTSSIERLNEILPRLEKVVSSKVSADQCDLHRRQGALFNRRCTDVDPNFVDNPLL